MDSWCILIKEVISMKEIWKPIPSFPEYEASNLGRIRSWRKGRGGEIPRIINPIASPKGKLRVFIRNEGVQHTCQVHRLVLEAFVGPCPEGLQACHYDDNSANNTLENLRWDTKEANLLDGIRNGRIRKGEDNGASVLTEEQVLEIRQRCHNGETDKAIALSLGTSISCITAVRRGRNWKHIGGQTICRPNRGETHTMAKLTEKDVLYIRQKHLEGARINDLARQFRMHRKSISAIVHKSAWPHI
jgi:hypothetical protein